MIIVKSIFHEDNKYYPQVFLCKYLYKLINVNKTNGSRVLFFITGPFLR